MEAKTGMTVAGNPVSGKRGTYNRQTAARVGPSGGRRAPRAEKPKGVQQTQRSTGQQVKNGTKRGQESDSCT